MKNAPLILLFVFVFFPSLFIRMYPVESESFQHDAIVSQLAAREGVVANAWDRVQAYQQRRFHPPLLSYLIIANNKIFGTGDFRSRLFSIILGALACFIAALSIYRLSTSRTTGLLVDDPPGWSAGGKASWTGGFFGGIMLCLLPVHLYVSRTANWDASYSLLSVSTLLSLSVYLLTRRFRHLVAAAVMGVLSFLLSELGAGLLPVFAAVFLTDVGRFDRPVWRRRWGAALLIAVGVTAVLWPAGVFKLDLLRTLRFRLYDSSVVDRNLPWWVFYKTMFEQAPAYTLSVVAGLGAFAVVWLRRRSKIEKRKRLTYSYLFSMLPFFLYVITVFLLSLKQRLVYIHHISDMFAPLTVLSVSALTVAARSLKAASRTVVVGLGVVVVVFSVFAAANPDPDVVGPQEHPGMQGVRDFLEKCPGARTYYHYSYAVEYYLPGARVERGYGRYWTRDILSALKTEGYDFIMSDASMFDHNFPSIAPIAVVLAPEYELAGTVYHRRTKESVVWIFALSGGTVQ